MTIPGDMLFFLARGIEIRFPPKFGRSLNPSDLPMITNFIFIRCGQILYRAAISRGHGCLGREREALGRSGRTEGF